MKKFLPIFFIIILNHCSFDTKSGIWKDGNQTLSDQNREKRFEDFETLYSDEKSFDKTISPSKNLNIILETAKKTDIWADEFFNSSNSLDNFIYNNLNEIALESGKLTKYQTNKKTLFDGTNAIIADNRGNIIIFSITEEKVILKYNFYKKKFKEIKKKLNIIIDNKVVYVSDNIGYLYALDYLNDKLIWAKNYKVPFRSNIKIINDKIILADQNNSLYLINKKNGNRLKKIPTEETTLKNEFKNSLAFARDSLFYLNTYGSLYAFEAEKMQIKWFRNLNQSLDLNTTNLFFSNPIFVKKNKIIVSTDPYLYILNENNGATIYKTSISSLTKPLISNEYLFLITKDNLLVCIDLRNGKVQYSLDISEEIAKFLQTKNKSINIKSFSLINDKIFIFLKNSFVVHFHKNGKINKISKLPSKISSLPIFINEKILFLNKKNKLILVN